MTYRGSRIVRREQVPVMGGRSNALFEASVEAAAAPIVLPSPGLLGLGGTMWFLSMGAFGFFFANTAATFLPIYLTERLHLSPAEAGYVLAARGLASFVSTYLAGIAIDRYGHKAAMTVGLLVAAASVLALPFAGSNLVVLAALVAATSVGRSAFRPAYNSRKVEVCPRDRYSQAYSLFIMAANGGLGAAALVGAYLMAWSPSLPFVFDACVLVVTTLLVSRLMGDAVTTAAAEAAPLNETHGAASPWLNVGFLKVCAVFFLVEMVEVEGLFAVPVLLVPEGRLSLSELATLMAAMSCSILLFSLAFSSTLKRWPQRLVASAGALAIGTGLTTVGLFRTHEGILVGWVVYCVGKIVFYPSLMQVGMSLYPPAAAGRYSAFYYSWAFLAVLIGPPLAGLMISSGMGNYLWWGCALTGLVAATIASLLLDELSPVTGEGSVEARR